MVRACGKITTGRHCDVKLPVLREQLQHMVKETYPRLNPSLARPSRSMLTSTSVSDVRLSTWAFRDPPKLLWERSAGTISPSLSWEYQSPQTDAKQNTTVPGSHLPSHNDSPLSRPTLISAESPWNTNPSLSAIRVRYGERRAADSGPTSTREVQRMKV